MPDQKIKNPERRACHFALLGRPTSYTDEIGAEICRRVAAGETITKIVDDLGLWSTTVLEWSASHSKFATEYARARAANEQRRVDEILQIIDESIQDWDVDEYGRRKVNSEVVNRSKLRAEGRIKYLQLVNPHKYNDNYRKKLIKISGFALAKTPTDKINLLCSLIETGDLCGDELERVLKLIESQLKIEDVRDLHERLKLIESKTK
jgi:hypothetical protein